MVMVGVIAAVVEVMHHRSHKKEWCQQERQFESWGASVTKKKLNLGEFYQSRK